MRVLKYLNLGKTATIVALIQLLVELDKTVLITSHTHSAIDNICTRLQKFKVDFIRLGSQSKIADNLKPHSEASLTEKCTTPEEMDKVYNSFVSGLCNVMEHLFIANFCRKL